MKEDIWPIKIAEWVRHWVAPVPHEYLNTNTETLDRRVKRLRKMWKKSKSADQKYIDEQFAFIISGPVPIADQQLLEAVVNVVGHLIYANKFAIPEFPEIPTHSLSREEVLDLDITLRDLEIRLTDEKKIHKVFFDLASDLVLIIRNHIPRTEPSPYKVPLLSLIDVHELTDQIRGELYDIMTAFYVVDVGDRFDELVKSTLAALEGFKSRTEDAELIGEINQAVEEVTAYAETRAGA